MLLFLDNCPPDLAAGEPWDAVVGCSVDGKSLYAVAGVKEVPGGNVMLTVKFQGVRLSWYRSFRDFDLPAIKAMARRVVPGALVAVSAAGLEDYGFAKVTRAFGWTGHAQTALLAL